MTTMRAVTDCKTDETGVTVVPKAISFPKGSAAVRLALASRVRVVVSDTA